jgi:hypothetical protein
VISRIDIATSADDAVLLVTLIVSPGSITIFCSPPTTTKDEPTGIGASLII